MGTASTDFCQPTPSRFGQLAHPNRVWNTAEPQAQAQGIAPAPSGFRGRGPLAAVFSASLLSLSWAAGVLAPPPAGQTPGVPASLGLSVDAAFGVDAQPPQRAEEILGALIVALKDPYFQEFSCIS